MKKKELLYVTILLLSSSIVFNSCSKDNDKNLVNVIEEEEKQPIEISWQTKAAMPSARYCGDAVVCNEKIYHIGGRSVSSIQKSNFEYDPATDTWVSKQGLPTNRFKLSTAVIDDKIYIIGGSVDGIMSSRVDVYYPETDTWEDSTAAMELPKPILFAGVVTINNTIFVSGGCDSKWNAYSSNYQGIIE